MDPATPYMGTAGDTDLLADVNVNKWTGYGFLFGHSLRYRIGIHSALESRGCLETIPKFSLS